MTDRTDRTDQALACHLTLLRLAGRISDELLTGVRRWLAEGRIPDLAIPVAGEVMSTEAPLIREDLSCSPGCSAKPATTRRSWRGPNGAGARRPPGAGSPPDRN